MPTIRQPAVANAHFVTEQVAVGGDLDYQDERLALRQLTELVDLGVTHVVDVRQERSDADLFADLAPHVGYLNLGIDDAGQQVPGSWFDSVTRWALDALQDPTTKLLLHCHMGINRGPSAGYAVLLSLGWDPVQALAAIRRARPIANVAYWADALDWHLDRLSVPRAERERQHRRVREWRDANRLDVVAVIRRIRSQESRSGGAA
jgi:predicted protein tyrosine phosphatase